MGWVLHAAFELLRIVRKGVVIEHLPGTWALLIYSSIWILGLAVCCRMCISHTKQQHGVASAKITIIEKPSLAGQKIYKKVKKKLRK